MKTSRAERQAKTYVDRMSIIIAVLDEHAPEVTDIEELAHRLAGALECFEEG